MDTTRKQVETKFKELIYVGYDTAAQNREGKTPLLAAIISRARLSLTVTELLVAEHSNTHATDRDRRGALHLCLSFTEGLKYFSKVCRGSPVTHESPYAVDSPKSEEACELESFKSWTDSNGLKVQLYDNGTAPVSGDYIIHKESMIADYDKSSRSSPLSSSDYDTDDTADYLCSGQTPRRQRCYWCNRTVYFEDDGLDKDEELDDDELAVYDYCEDRDVDDFKMSESSNADSEPWMCKARVRLKLHALLKAGCCPNALDDKGLTPSDYAEREGLWPQWEWTLFHSGFRHDKETDSWVRVS